MRNLALSLIEFLARHILASGVRSRVLAGVESLLKRILIEGRLPHRIQDVLAERSLWLINAVRRARFRVHCIECDSCGFVYPRDDLKMVRKSDGKSYPECTSCADLTGWVRKVLTGKRAA